jgi:hypothetical protein
MSKLENAGYLNIRQFMEDYNKLSSEVSKYEEELGSWQMECREIEIQKRYEQGQISVRSGNRQFQKQKGR